MKIEITNKFDNKIFDRIEVSFEITHAGEQTPSRHDIKKALSAQLGADESLIALVKIETIFGFGKSKGLAMLYKDKANMEKIERIYLVKRNKAAEKKEEPKTEEAKPDGEEKPSEEAPKEEVKEEAKSEEKPVEEAKEEAKE